MIVKGHTEDNWWSNQCSHYHIPRDHDVKKQWILKHRQLIKTRLYYVYYLALLAMSGQTYCLQLARISPFTRPLHSPPSLARLVIELRGVLSLLHHVFGHVPHQKEREGDRPSLTKTIVNPHIQRCLHIYEYCTQTEDGPDDGRLLDRKLPDFPGRRRGPSTFTRGIL